MSELPDRYDPSITEPAVYAQWLEANCFAADAARSSRLGGDRVPYTIVMPPPNVTGILHVGHGLNNTVQDVLIRWARMRQTEALWLPGTDHAGIATQNVVERLIAQEGKTRFDVGRETFVKRTEAFVEEKGGVILKQLRALGATADWSRTAYTLSPELSRAVREAFVRLYERGLIYKGHRVIHWCPRCLTSLSDEEAEFQDEPGSLYHIKYPLTEDPSRGLAIATTRPETMLADVAVAVNPKDDRYRSLIGKTVRLPIVHVDIPIVADEYADPEFGTGVVKITPAHDANDFDVGERHRLPAPVVIDEHGKMREERDAAGRVPADLIGVDRFEARERVVERLRAEGALLRVEPHQHAVRHCYRCDTVVVQGETVDGGQGAAVRTGAIRILPERWEGVYVHWMENIRDWNISRQLWWGHRIPVWYCDECDPPQNLIVSRDDVRACPHCDGPVRQDEDVLDTWFSSWLWPLSTLGWPNEQARDLKAFYPTDVLVTAPEILFFWVSRMIMAGYAFLGRAPYHSVYLHGTARDTLHRRMSKSLGNGIDPLDVVTLYGADAFRWTMIAGLGIGADVILDPADLEKSFSPGRNFATKLWNIGRFLLSNLGDAPVRPLRDIDERQLALPDAWILERFDAAVAECDGALGPLQPTKAADDADGRHWRDDERYAGLRLNEYAESARRFVWNELADWYLESVKGRLGADAEPNDREVARAVLLHVFDGALRLLHPVVPFITEALWQKLPGRKTGEFLIRAEWPRLGAAPEDGRGKDFERVRDAVLAVRQIRGDYNVAPGKMLDVVILAPNDRRVYDENAPTIGRLGRARVSISTGPAPESAAHAVLGGGNEIVVPLAGLIDVDKECQRLRGELAALEKQIVSREQRLANPKYVERAPEHVVRSDRATLDEMISKRGQLSEKVRTLCGA